MSPAVGGGATCWKPVEMPGSAWLALCRIARRVLEPADRAFNFALDLVCFAFDLQLLIAESLPGRALDAPFGLIRGPFDPILIHQSRSSCCLAEEEQPDSRGFVAIFMSEHP